MLKCKDVPEQTSLYIDDSLAWHQKLGWKMHLMMCHHCRRFIRHFKLSIRVSREIGNPRLPDEEAKLIARRVIKLSQE